MGIVTKIRLETRKDIPTVRQINELAFGQTTEANIVDAIRQNCHDTVSLVAELDGHVVGHILFSPVTIDMPERMVNGMGLGPMAVHPEYQNEGIGSALVRKGLAMLGDKRCPFVVVLGHPKYYPRFGFEAASKSIIFCQWGGVPDEAFMILILDHVAMAGVSGVARYRSEFDGAV